MENYYNLPNSQLNRLQQIQNSLVRAVVNAPKFSHQSLQWLKINDRIKCNFPSVTYKVLTTWPTTNRSFRHASPVCQINFLLHFIASS